MALEGLNLEISLDAHTDPESTGFKLEVTIKADFDPTARSYTYEELEQAIRTAALAAWYNAWDAAAHVMQEHRGDAAAQLEKGHIQVSQQRNWQK